MPALKSLSAALLCTGLLAAAPAALATVTASAQMSGLYIQLFDLDAGDGIAPAVTFTNSATAAYVYAYVSPDSGATYVNSYDQGALGGAFSVSSVLGLLSASGSTQAGDAYTLGSGPGGQAAASATGAGSYVYGEGFALSGNFTLTAKTLMVLSATGSASTSSTVLGEYAYANGYVQLSDNSGYSYGYSYSVIQTDGYSYGGGGPAIQATFANLSGVSAAGYVSAGAYADARGIAGVPEPASLALMLFGLAAVGAMAKRRRQR